MKRIVLPLLLGALAVFAPLAHAAGASSVRAILVTASNQKGPADPRLAPYESALQRNVPESSFRFVAENSSALAARGRTTISLGDADRIEVERDGAGPSLKVRWFHRDRPIMGATITQAAGTPFVYLHRPSEGDPRLVILVAN